MSAPAEPVLSLRDVTKHFGGVRAVNRMSLDVPSGAITGIIGPNGSGKTTLFNLISGIYEPQAGEIVFRGRPIHGEPPHRVSMLGVARTFQNIRLFNEMLVIENLLVGMHAQLLSGLWAAGLRTRRFIAEEQSALQSAIELLEFFPELAGTHDTVVKNLSYANRRRVEILRALAARPALLLLDEPAAGMNTTEAAKLLRDIRRIRDRGVTVLLIEHNMSVISGVADHVVAMDQGEKVVE